MNSNVAQTKARSFSNTSALEEWSERTAPQLFDSTLADLESLRMGSAIIEDDASKPGTKPPPGTKPATPGQPKPKKPGENPNTRPGKGKPCRGGPCRF